MKKIRIPDRGETFSRLTFLCVNELDPRKQKHGLFRCACGEIKSQNLYHVLGGRIISCGCYARQDRKTMHLKHGMARWKNQSAEYRVWAEMKKRCYNPLCRAYKNYGGRGIKICDDWLNDFEKFYKYVGQRPSPKHSIDRINNDGNYEPGNVRWALKKTQCNNTRRTVFLIIDGIKKPLQEWAHQAKINGDAIRSRLKLGWSPKDAVFTPTRVGDFRNKKYKERDCSAVPSTLTMESKMKSLLSLAVLGIALVAVPMKAHAIGWEEGLKHCHHVVPGLQHTLPFSLQAAGAIGAIGVGVTIFTAEEWINSNALVDAADYLGLNVYDSNGVPMKPTGQQVSEIQVTEPQVATNTDFPVYSGGHFGG